MAFPEYEPDTTDDDNLVYTLTSIDEITRLYSTAAEKLHTDDLNPDDDNYNSENNLDVNRDNFLLELCQRASSHVMSFLGPRYQVEQIYKIPRIREIATYWAVYKLSRRRGNEPVYEEEYIEAMDELKDYRDGFRYLDAPSSGPRAYIQSYIIDNRYGYRPTRVITAGSSSTIPGQNLQRYYGFGWL